MDCLNLDPTLDLHWANYGGGTYTYGQSIYLLAGDWLMSWVYQPSTTYSHAMRNCIPIGFVSLKPKAAATPNDRSHTVKLTRAPITWPTTY